MDGYPCQGIAVDMTSRVPVQSSSHKEKSGRCWWWHRNQIMICSIRDLCQHLYDTLSLGNKKKISTNCCQILVIKFQNDLSHRAINKPLLSFWECLWEFVAERQHGKQSSAGWSWGTSQARETRTSHHPEHFTDRAFQAALGMHFDHRTTLKHTLNWNSNTDGNFLLELASSTNIRGSVRIARLAGRVKTAGNKSSYNCTELGENWSFGGTAARARDSVKQGYVLFVKEKGLLWFPRQEEAAFCLYYTTELDQICPFLESQKSHLLFVTVKTMWPMLIEK